MPPLSPVEPSNRSVWIVVRAYNEAPRLAATLRSVLTRYEQVVVVDDGSQDGTSSVAGEFSVWLVRHPINCGAGGALATGFEFALAHGATVIVCFDADGQHRIEDVPRLVEHLEQADLDVVFGSRFLGAHEGMPWTRRWVLAAGVWFTYLHSGLRLTDAHNGLRAFSRRAAREIKISHGGMAYASEICDEIARLGLRVGEVPVTIRYTAETLAKGQSSWNALRILGKWLLGRIVV